MCGFVMGVLELVYGRGPCVLIARVSHRVGVEGGERDGRGRVRRVLENRIKYVNL